MRPMNRLLVSGMTLLLSFCAIHGAFAGEPEWNPAALKECDRACLVGIMDGYMDAIFKHDPKAVPPLSIDVRMTENTGEMTVGEGVLWRNKVEPTSFKIYVADPIAQQVAQQARLKVGGQGYFGRRSTESGSRKDPGD